MKRLKLESVISKITCQNLLRTTIESVKLFNSQTDNYLATSMSLLKQKKMQRYFNYIRYYNSKKKSLKDRFETLKLKTEAQQVSKFMQIWTNTYNIE